MFGRANTRATRPSGGQPSEGKGPDRLYGSKGDLRSLGSGEKGGIGGRRVMNLLRPSHSLPTRASSLHEPHRGLRPPPETRRNVDTESDMIPGSELDIEEVHHAHLIEYCENRCNQPCRLRSNAGSDTDGETSGGSGRQRRYRRRGTPKDRGAAMDMSLSPPRVLWFAQSDRYEMCLPSEDKPRRGGTAPTVGILGAG